MAYQHQIDREVKSGCLDNDDNRRTISHHPSAEAKNTTQGATAHDRIMAAIALEMEAKARRAVASIIKARARQFMRQPMQLEAIEPELATAAPNKLIETGFKILSHEMRSPRRLFGFGGEIPALNAKAVILLGRYQRWLEARQLYLFAAE